ncbi:MAG: imidazole glycerol phosphate synthase subunit HisH [Proteobacteria bacterium]|nr:imidazole glycerol phosphate synthase subunit HisH [Pseudomonadota bacterium]
MNDRQVAVVDYGIGNVFSVCRALERCGAKVILTGDVSQIEAASRLVLPGVGAFADGMLGLRERGLVEPIRRFARSGRPLLGICLGMQMLATVSEEFGRHEGLNLIPGRVVAVPDRALEGHLQKIPHVGWSALVAAPGAIWSESLLRDTPEGTAVYLVHSFSVVPDDHRHGLADCLYGGHRIAAAMRSGRIVGCQFHPEKSGEAGLRMLAQFLDA